MKELLNILKHITEDERAELSHQMHIVRQVCMAEQAYQGAPMAHLEDRQKAAEFLENYLTKLKTELAAEAKVKERHEVEKLFISLVSKKEELMEYLHEENHGRPSWQHVSHFNSDLYEKAIKQEVVEVRKRFGALVGDDATREEVQTMVSLLNQTGLFELAEISEKMITDYPKWCVVLMLPGEPPFAAMLVRRSYKH